MYVYIYSYYVDLLDYMDFIIDFVLGMVNFDVNFLELNDVDVLIVFYMKLIVNVIVMVSICFIVFLLEKDVLY